MQRWMRRGLVLSLLTTLVLGCTHEEQPPPVPPPPDDLSTWSIPVLVQPQVPPLLPTPVEDKPTPAEKVYEYAPGTTYVIPVAINMPLDIMLEAGEQLRNLVGGDRTPTEGQTEVWQVKEGASGSGETARSHVFVTVTTAGRTNGVVLTTTRRSYLLTLKSVGRSPVRVVRWTYPPETTPPLQATEPGLLPDPETPVKYHVGYTLASTHPQPPVWLPKAVVDSGTKTYILFPELALFDTVPVVREIGPNGPQLVNARQFLNVVILDKLVSRLELRVGLGEQAEVVTVTRGALRTIQCPDEPECPVWPQAAQVLARKGSSTTPPTTRPVIPPPPPGPPPPPPHAEANEQQGATP
jgi:type IV secretion system protein VirB9